MSRDLYREAAILRRRERDSAHPPCDLCGGTWWYGGARIWHVTRWVKDGDAVNGYRPEFCPRSKYGRRQSEAEQDAEREALAGPRCPHGFADPAECPGCLDLADRLRQEHDPEAAL